MDFHQDLADYRTYADWRELSSVERARKFVTACIRLRGAIDGGTNFGNELRLPNKTEVRQAQAEAQMFIDSQTTGDIGPGAGLVALDFTGYRR